MEESQEDNNRSGQLQPLAAEAHSLIDLARSDLPAAEARFNALGFERQFGLVRAVHGDERKEVLYLKNDCTDLVQALGQQEFYGMIMEIGPTDALSLLDAATPGQIQQILDLECWADGAVDRRKVLNWLELLVKLEEEELHRILPGLDAAQLAVMLGHWIHRAEAPDATPDVRTSRHYAVTPGSIDVDQPLVSAILAEMYDADEQLFSRVVGSALTERDYAAELEAAAEREARLEQQGYPGEAEAKLIYVEVPMDELPAAATTESLPALAKQEDKSFLRTVTEAAAREGHLSEETIQRIEQGLVALANKVMVAERIDRSGPGGSELAAEVAANYVGLGLEHISGGDIATAAEGLIEYELDFLFRIGHTLLCGLRRRLWRELGGFDLTALAFRLGRPYDAILDAVRRERPTLPVGEHKGLVRLIRSLNEIAYVEELIDEMGDIVLLHEDVLPVWPEAYGSPEKGNERTYGAVSGSIAASAIIGKLPPGPLTPKEVRGLLPALKDEAGEAERIALEWLGILLGQAGWVEGPSARAKSFWHDRIAAMRQELGALGGSPTDENIRNLRSLVVASG